MSDWRDAIIDIAHQAGEAIMAVYRRDDFDIETKGDNSPLTAADLAANRVIVDGLRALTPDIPILSEEGKEIAWDARRGWTRFWLVDPLDGTREFIKRNGEFTANIALIENAEPTLGVVHAPALDYTIWGQRGVGAALREGNEDIGVQTRRPAIAPLRVAASRSHLDDKTAAAIARMGDTERRGMGSSLKFCKIAEGGTDVYLRFGPTSEWDTAAGQCVLEAAGGVVLGMDGQPFRYGRKESLLNPEFLALGDADLPWRDWLA
ncbi:MAG: 3'(2'),5'-bisphosphate nucleotidase CysQ [Lysobacteraceae bacterium]